MATHYLVSGTISSVSYFPSYGLLQVSGCLSNLTATLSLAGTNITQTGTASCTVSQSGNSITCTASFTFSSTVSASGYTLTITSGSCTVGGANLQLLSVSCNQSVSLTGNVTVTFNETLS